jgi:hypothetical protein
VHGLGLTYHRLGNHFGQTMELLGDVAKWKLVSVSFEIVLISMQDRLENHFGQTMDLLGDVGQMEAHFGPVGDSVNLHTRLVYDLRRT